MRWELFTYPDNAAAGEEILIADRDRTRISHAPDFAKKIRFKTVHVP